MLRILILEDNPIDAKLNVVQLKKENISFESMLVENEKDFRNELINYKPDVILSDYNLPDFNGMQALEICKTHTPDIPFIMVTGALNDETAAHCIKEGAWDYVIKEHLGYLGTAVNNALEKKKQNNIQKELKGQLEQSRRLETIGTLAGGIAHDFNNILATILGYVEIALINEEKTEKAFDYLRKIEKASLRAKDIVEQILIFSRQSRIFELKELHLQDIISEAVELIEDSTPDNIQVKLDMEKKHETVMADESQIYQLILNLCKNGIQAMSKTGNKLSVSLTSNKCDQKFRNIYPDFKGDSYALIKIEDSGIGMSEAVLARLFEPFFTTRDVGSGTGLGLSVVHGIIKNHKGKIKVESKLGTGTVFSIFLPILKKNP